jgi:hypothetical protein
MENENEHVVIGKITNIDFQTQTMLVKDREGVSWTLKWRSKPEVVDDLCRKQKPGFRVKVTTIKNPNEENAKFWISNVQYDDSYKQRKGYSSSPEEQKLILLQSCLRTGAQVWCEVLNTYAPEIFFGQDVPADEKEVGRIFEASMDTIMERAKRDAATLLAEAKKDA